MLEAFDLECIRGDRILFSDIGFRLEPGELLYLQGKNGAGKSSMLAMLCGLARPHAGDIHWRGKPLRQAGEAFRAELCYLGHLNAIKEELTPLENLLTSANLAGEPLTEAEALDALDRIGLASRAHLACRFLSQGQKRRVALARLTHEKRTLWVLDEPYAALDVAAVELVAGLISTHLQRGGLAVLTSHQEAHVTTAPIRELKLS